MTPLRNLMIRELELHRKAPGTIKQYVSAVAELARHYRRSPDSISIEEVRDFIHHLITQRKVAFSTCNVRLAGIRFFFQQVLRRDDFPLRVPAKRSGRLKGATVTLDAMGCQKEIAQKIIERGGQYVLALKDNHPTLHEAVAAEFTEALEADVRPAGLRRQVTVETNRGRHERRECFVLPAPKTLSDFAGWAGLATIVMVLRITQVAGRETGQVSYFLSSLPARVKTLAKLVRQHWSIESQLHWVLDVTFTEDASRIRQRHAPQTSAMLRRLAVSILSSDTSLKDSLRGKRYRACLSTDTLERILLGFVEK
jgi:predicted transposase YbfD/YdcC